MIFDWRQFITTVLVQAVIYFGILAARGSLSVACLVAIIVPAVFMKPYLRKK